MTRSVRWTEEKIKALRLPDGKNEQRTLVEPGLYIYLRRRSTGDLAKQWQYRAQVDGVRRWLSLGAFPGVGQAKAHAEMLTHRVVHEAAKKGEADHPVLTAQSARKASKAEPTVADVFVAWIADKRLGSPRTGGRPVRERTVQILSENYAADIKATVGSHRVNKLTPEALQSCIDAPRKRGSPGSAAHVYRTLRGLVKFAIGKRYITGADPMRGIENPKPYRPATVVNAASDSEVLALLSALEDSGVWASTKLAVELSLLTGARPSEIRLATWGEFRLEQAVWMLPADRVKSGTAFRIHLSAQAVDVLRRAQVLGKSKPSHFVFPGAKSVGDKPTALEKTAVARALFRLTERTVAAGGKKLRPHDLRRTFRTMLSRLGVAPHIAELCMNHQETETMRRVYDGHDYGAETAAAWDLAGSHIEALREGGAVVIPLKHRA